MHTRKKYCTTTAAAAAAAATSRVGTLRISILAHTQGSILLAFNKAQHKSRAGNEEEEEEEEEVEKEVEISGEIKKDLPQHNDFFFSFLSFFLFHRARHKSFFSPLFF